MSIEKINFASLCEGVETFGYSMIKKISEEKTAKNGNIYHTISLIDGSNSVDITLFKKREEILFKEKDVIEGKYCKRGDYIDLLNYRVEPNADWRDFVKSSPIKGEDCFNKISLTLFQMMKESGADEKNSLYALAGAILSEYKEKMIWYPASESYHHEYIGGLAYYILKCLVDAYNLTKGIHKVRADVIAAALCIAPISALFALDAGEMGEAKKNIYGVINNYSEMSLKVAEKKAALIGVKPEDMLALSICIKAYRERKAWGAIIEPVTEEAFFVATIATLNAKSSIYEDLKEGLSYGEITDSPKLGHSVMKL